MSKRYSPRLKFQVVIEVISESKDINGLSEVVQERVHYWNRMRRHSSLDYRTPSNYT